jgi:predicted acylesterase/phospholipase RssA
VVCHDVVKGCPRYFATGDDRGVRLTDAVRASASIPVLLPAMRVHCPQDRTTLLLTDGGISDCVPVAFARRNPLGATHVIVSDCRAFAGRPPAHDDRVLYVRPRLPSTGTLWAPASTLVSAVREGSRAVSDEALREIRGWIAVREAAGERAAAR